MRTVPPESNLSESPHSVEEVLGWGGHSELLFFSPSSPSSFVTANINAFHTVTNDEKR